MALTLPSAKIDQMNRFLLNNMATRAKNWHILNPISSATGQYIAITQVSDQGIRTLLYTSF